MAKKIAKKVEEVVEEVVEQEVPEVEEEVEFVMPIDSMDFAYEVKAGKGTFPQMSDEDVIAFVASTLGKVDKIVITRL